LALFEGAAFTLPAVMAAKTMRLANSERTGQVNTGHELAGRERIKEPPGFS
jgi:hypothetical protein